MMKANMADLQDAEEATSGPPPRPLKLVPGLPTKKSVAAVRAKLEALGTSKEAAAAVAKALVDPDSAVTLMETPTAYRVPGGELLAIRVAVYTHRVISDPTNPRAGTQLAFPVAISPGTDHRAPFMPLKSPRAEDGCFTLSADNSDHLSWQLDLTMNAVYLMNVPKPAIAEQGVMEPPLAIPLHLDFATGRKSGVLMVREGSSRVTHAQKILQLSAHDLLDIFTDDRTLASVIAEANTIVTASARSVKDADRSRVRVMTMPIDLVIGFKADPGGNLTLGEAVTAKVAQDHLNHKQQWDEPARDVYLGDACLNALRSEKLVTALEHDWLAGRLTSAQARAQDLEFFSEDRWVHLLWFFTTKKMPYTSIIRKPIANELAEDGARSSVRVKHDRLPLAVSLAMRARRKVVTEVTVERESRLLAESIPPQAWNITWSLSDGNIQALVKRAISDCEARRPSPAGIELVVRATWFLVVHGQMNMPRNDTGVGGDRRSPSELLIEALGSVRGIKQLERVIVDGRDGVRGALVLDADGTVDVNGLGEPVRLDDNHMRNEVAPRQGPVGPQVRQPRDAYLDAVAILMRKIREVIAADVDIRSIDGSDGRPLYIAEGLPKSYTGEARKNLEDVLRHLAEYEMQGAVAEALEAKDRGAGNAAAGG